MDNLTHTLVGATLAKAGLERASPYATAACMLAANAPDVDVLSRLGGRWFSLEHHRGITHSIVGTLTLGLLLPLAFYAVERAVARARGTSPRVRLRGLAVAALIACATHPLLDWLNSYGVRPLLPWAGRRFYGDILFIIDPWLWLVLGGAAFLLTARARWRVWAWGMLAAVLTTAIILLPRWFNATLPASVPVLWIAGLALIIGLHRARLGARLGASLARAALAAVVCYCAALAFAHARALTQTRATAATIAQPHAEAVLRVAAMPTFADPSDWISVVETDGATYRFETRLRADGPVAANSVVRYAKPQGEAAAQVARAGADERARVFLRFARFPIVQLQPDGPGDTLVRFADLRFSAPEQTRTPARGFSLDVRVAGATR